MRNWFVALVCGAAIVCGGVVPAAAAAAHPLDKLISREEKEDVPYQYRKRIVKYKTDEAKGTIIVETKKRFLYYILGDGKAERYGVGVGREGFLWSGTAYIKKKAMWPKWTPAPEAIARSPYLEPYKKGMPGGRDNPLGARAMYLFNDGGDTLFRIHGTTNPKSIGKGGTAGCLRMLNQEIVQLYERVPMGTKVIVK
jgi:lipoprotein-anchoring transpeptidase ErfK/SrfK